MTFPPLSHTKTWILGPKMLSQHGPELLTVDQGGRGRHRGKARKLKSGADHVASLLLMLGRTRIGGLLLECSAIE